MDDVIDPARHYAAAMDSVNLIHALLADPPSDMSSEEVTDTISRNVEHLRIMVGKDFWTSEDLQPFHDAIAAGKA